MIMTINEDRETEVIITANEKVIVSEADKEPIEGLQIIINTMPSLQAQKKIKTVTETH
jgi:hypothetical protein